LKGIKILGVKFSHNSHVSFFDFNEVKVNGWIVAVEQTNLGFLYTIEREDREPDEEVLESKLVLLSDPHENKS